MEVSEKNKPPFTAKLIRIFDDIKLAHTVFALPFALASAHIAFDGQYDLRKLLLILACMFTARSAAMAFNRWLDRDIDSVNPRTKHRSIPSGIVSPQEMLIFVIINSSLFVIFTFLLNFLAFALSPIALSVILGYSYFKRFTSWSHMVLGLSLAIAPTGAWIAVRGEFDLIPILLSLAVIFWVAGFDIIYACQDVDFDEMANIYSIPRKFGIAGALAISFGCHLATIALLILFGHLANFGLIYFITVGIVTLILLIEHVIVTPSNLSMWGIAFFTLNGVVSILFFLGVVLDTVF